jgi:hypothetical protein
LFGLDNALNQAFRFLVLTVGTAVAIAAVLHYRQTRDMYDFAEQVSRKKPKSGGAAQVSPED